MKLGNEREKEWGRVVDIRTVILKKWGKTVNRKENTDSGLCPRVSAGNTQVWMFIETIVIINKEIWEGPSQSTL